MQDVFKRIIDKLIEQKKGNPFIYGKNDKSRDASISRQTLDYAIEIVEQTATECKHGHFGCNSNGQHEKCSKCSDYDCKRRNREWFGAEDDNNGWIPCSERMPDVEINPVTNDYVRHNVTFKNGNVSDVRCYAYGEASGGKHWPNGGQIMDEYVIAWQPLPAPYQPHICTNNDCVFNEGKDCHAAEGCAGYERKQTNADQIRSMSDEELATNMMCPNESGLGEIECDKGDNCNCYECLLKWLQSEVEVDNFD